MNINMLREIVKESWDAETCKSELQPLWNDNSKMVGQDDITALVVNDYVGGKIMACLNAKECHYFNVLENEIIDLSAEKNSFIDYSDSVMITRDYLLGNSKIKNRYLKLMKNINKNALQLVDESRSSLQNNKKHVLIRK